MKKVGFIGYGVRAKYLMKAVESLKADIAVAAVADPCIDGVRERTAGTSYFKSTVYYESADEMLEQEKLDGIFLCTRCGLHTAYAEKVLRRGIPLFLEKPVAITENETERLRALLPIAEGKVTVSFPLRLTSICEEVHSLVANGSIGEITQIQAVNNVPYGSVYYHSWYRDERLTGGLFLQKMTHDIDYLTYLAGMGVTGVFAQSRKLYYKGDMPAGTVCPECPRYRSCPESSYIVEHVWKDEVEGDSCCFAVDTGNMDTASVIFTLDNGALLSYNQNFIVKKSAARRGCRVLGTKGSVEFDFNTGEIREDRYFTSQTVLHSFSSSGQHFGGDESLILDFFSVMAGKGGRCSLLEGIQSAEACLAAKRSDETAAFVPIRCGA